MRCRNCVHFRRLCSEALFAAKRGLVQFELQCTSCKVLGSQESSTSGSATQNTRIHQPSSVHHILRPFMARTRQVESSSQIHPDQCRSFRPVFRPKWLQCARVAGFPLTSADHGVLRRKCHHVSVCPCTEWDCPVRVSI